MSHTTAITAVVISDVNALQAAINELASEGVKCSLLENCKPRAYSSGQEGMGTAPYVVKLNDATYDVGLYDNGDGGFEARTDFWNGSVEKVLGVETNVNEEREQARLGKLFQRYAVCATENHAALNGYSTTRSQKEDGTLQLVMTQAA